LEELQKIQTILVLNHISISCSQSRIVLWTRSNVAEAGKPVFIVQLSNWPAIKAEKDLLQKNWKYARKKI